LINRRSTLSFTLSFNGLTLSFKSLLLRR